MQFGGSLGVVLGKQSKLCSVALCGVIGVQLFLYTMLFDIHFFLRNVAVIGGTYTCRNTPTTAPQDPARFNARRLFPADTRGCP